MDTTTTYVGLNLSSPFIAGASPLSDELDTVKRLEDAGAAAIVLQSLFEEQLAGESLATHEFIDSPAESFAEAVTYFPTPKNFQIGPEEYLHHLSRVKESVSVPVFGSLNGLTPGGWLKFAQLMEQAGADGLELNVYYLATDPQETGSLLEERTMEMIRTVKATVKIPLAVKVSLFYSSFANFSRDLVEGGADGLVIFNRFYQPDIDVEDLEVVRKLRLSDSSELPLRLRWLAILSGRTDASLAVTGGVHTAIDVVKALMSGAHAVQMVSALLKQGPEYLATVKRELIEWMDAHEYSSVNQMRGSMNLHRCPDPKAYERANYIQILRSLNLLNMKG
jgi:dihydroorotate dehydrogenase (fumarate)